MNTYSFIKYSCIISMFALFTGCSTSQQRVFTPKDAISIIAESKIRKKRSMLSDFVQALSAKQEETALGLLSEQDRNWLLDGGSSINPKVKKYLLSIDINEVSKNEQIGIENDKITGLRYYLSNNFVGLNASPFSPNNS